MHALQEAARDSGDVRLDLQALAAECVQLQQALQACGA